MGAVVDYGRGALTRSRFREVNAEPLTTPQYEVRPHPLGAKRADRRIANRMFGNTRHVIAVETKLRERHGDVGLAPAERGGRHRRLQEPFEPGGAEAQHDLTEGNDLRHKRASRAARTLPMMRRALSTIGPKLPASMTRASSSAVPTPT